MVNRHSPEDQGPTFHQSMRVVPQPHPHDKALDAIMGRPLAPDPLRQAQLSSKS
jgi:hypothetical protein